MNIDPIQMFLSDVLQPNFNNKIYFNQLFEYYNQWILNQQFICYLGKYKFYNELRKLSKCWSKDTKGGYYIKGYELK